MTYDMKKSIKDFEKHLLSKIEVYNLSSPNKASVHAYERINNMFNIDNISTNDIANLTKKELEEVLDLIYLNQSTKERILNSFLTNKKNPQEHADYFVEIIAYIKMFVKQYLMRSSLNHEYSESQIEECNKYIKLFNEPDITSYTTLDQFDELMEFINNQGLIDDDKANLIEYINEINLNLAKKKTVSPNITNRVNSLVSTFIKEEYIEYINVAEKLIENEEIDLETLETISRQAADQYELQDAFVLYNVILTLMIVSKYNEIVESNEEINKTELEELFNKLHYNDELLDEAMVILQENINALYLDKKDAEEYKHEDLEDLSMIPDEAIMFKLSSTILRIKELYDLIINTNKEDSNYYNLRSELENVICKYNVMSYELISSSNTR